MAAQVSANTPGDSLLYSFTPGTSTRGGGNVATPPPLASPRRPRTQSVPGEPGHRGDAGETHSDLQVSPRAASILMPARPPTGATGRCGSADRHMGPSNGNTSSSSSCGGAMPQLVGSVGAGTGSAVGMRQSANGTANIGLPKLDHPAVFGGGTGAMELPGLGMTSPGRRSLNGAVCDGGTSSSMDVPSGAFDGSPPPSPRQGVPAVLAPLRVSGNFGPGGSGAAGAAAALADGSSGAASLGWCAGTPTFVSSNSRRYNAAGPVEVGCVALSSGSFTTAYDGSVATPLTPSLPAGGLCAPPRRANSLTGRGMGAGGRLGELDGVLGAPGGDRDGGAADPSGASSSTAVKLLCEINADLQRTSAAFLALQAPASRPWSAAAVATAAAPPPPLAGQPLTALKDTAPELHSDLRIAVRRAFQVMRQELAAGPSGRQLASGAHECWAALDAFLEGTAGFDAARRRGGIEPPLELTAPGGSPAAARPQPPSACDAASEADHLRATNQELQRQLDDCRVRLALAEARAADAEAEAGRCSPAPAGPGPRPPLTSASPPLTSASPPLDRCCGSSPRRGKHARAQPPRDDAASVTDGSGAELSGDEGGGGGGSSAGGGAAGAGEGPRRFDRAAVLARGPSYGEMVIEEDDSEDDLDLAGIDARRQMLTIHSASFAEWVRGVRRR